jgi:FkbM family methyltransferase
MRGKYKPGQAAAIFPWWSDEARWFIVGGPADADEAQTVARAYPNVKCLGVEPNPDYVAYQKGLDFPGEVLPYALWDTDGETLNLSVPTTNPRAGTVCRDMEGITLDTFKVQARTLDSLSDEFGPFDNCVLWIDVEFAEAQVLRGASRLLAEKKILLINLEAWDSTIKEIEEILLPHGFEVVKEWSYTVRDKRDVVFQLKR